MEGAGGGGGPSNVKRKVISNAYKLFEVLHDDTVQAKDKLPLMTEVLRGDDVDINFRDLHGGSNTLLHGAVSHGFVCVVKLLLEYKAHVDSKNAEGNTPLHIALSCGIVDTDTMIPKKKARLDMMHVKDEAPLYLDLNDTQMSIISLLMNYQPDIRIQNNAGVTPLGLAEKMDKQGIYDILYSSLNTRDPQPQDTFHSDQDTPPAVAGTSVANGGNQDEQTADPLADIPETYATAGAKDSFHGTVYHLCLLMILAIRAFIMGCAFRLGTEVKEAGQFDDIVLYHYTKSGARKTLFVQVKHKASAEKKITLNDLLATGDKAEFSLLKYFKSFVKIKLSKGQEADNIDFVICTNAPFDFQDDDPGKLKPVQVGNKIFWKTLENSGISLTLCEIKEDIEKEDTYKDFFEEGKRYKLVVDGNTEELLKTYMEKVYSPKLAGTPSSNNGPLLTHLRDGKSLKTFLTNLIFVFTEELDEKLLTKAIKHLNETKNLKLDINLFTDAFHNKIFLWFSDKIGKWLKKETVKEMTESITDGFNTFASSWITRAYADKLLTSRIQFKDEKLVELNEYLNKYQIVNVVTPMESKLTLIQVAQAIKHASSNTAIAIAQPGSNKNDSYMFVRVSSLLPCSNQEIVVDAFKSPGKHDLLVIDCLSKTEKVPHEQLKTLRDKLLDITTNNSQKTLVLIAPENHVLAEMFSSCSGYYKHTVSNTWKDLTNETQDILLETEVYFQGQLVELNQVIDKTETELLEIVPLEVLIGDVILVIGTELPADIGYNDVYYIERILSSVDLILLKNNIIQDESNSKFEGKLAFTETDFQKLCIKHPGENIHLIEKRVDGLSWVKSQGEFTALRPYIASTIYQSRSEEEFFNFFKLQRVVIISDPAGMGKSTVLSHFSNAIQAKYEGTLVFRIDLNLHTTLLAKHKKMSTKFDNSSALQFLCNEIIMVKTPLEVALFKRKGKVFLLFDGFDEISPDYEETVLGLIQNLTEATEAHIWITTRPFMKEKLEDTLRLWSSSLQPFSEQSQVEFLTKYWKHMKPMQYSDEGRIKYFAASLVLMLSESISDEERKFTGIPLQMKMLAECFVYDFEKSLDIKKCFNLVDLYRTFIEKKFEIYQIEKIKTDPSKVGSSHIQNKYFVLCVKQHQYLALSVILSEEEYAHLLLDYKSVIGSDEDIKVINKIGIINLTNGKPHFIHRTFAEYCVAEYFTELLKDPKSINSKVKSFILFELLRSKNYLVIRAFLNGLLGKCQPAIDTLREFQTPVLTKDDINNKYEKINGNLHLTAYEGNTHILIYLLNAIKGADEIVLIKLLQQSNTSLLHLAAANNDVKFIKTLLQWTHDNTDPGQRIPDLMLEALDETSINTLMIASREGHIDVIHTLQQWTIKGGQEIVEGMLNACGIDGETPLHYASEGGHKHVVQTLLQWARDNSNEGQETVERMLKACDQDDETPLHYASGEGHNDVVQTLLQWARDNSNEGQETVKQILKACNTDGETPLHYASHRGHNDVVQTLLQWASGKSNEGQETVKQMLEACDSDDATPLHYASREGTNDEVQILLLIARGTSNEGQETVKRMLNACDTEHKTPLHCASRGGHNDVVKTLLQWARDNSNEGQETVERMLNAYDAKHKTPLHYASEKGKNYVVQTLLKWARDNSNEGQVTVERMLNACDAKHKTPLHYASEEGNNGVVHTLLQWARDNSNDGQEAVERMLKACCMYGTTPLHYASEEGNNDVVHTLLQQARGKSNEGQETVKQMLKACNTDGKTPLHYASRKGNNDVVKTLLQWALENSNDGQEAVERMLKACSMYGTTPLHYASKGGHNDVVQTLLQWARANLVKGQATVEQMLEARCNVGYTSLHYASERGHNDAVQALLQWARDNSNEGQETAERMLKACGEYGMTPLHYASKRGHNDVVQTLLQWAHANLVKGQDTVEQMLEARCNVGYTSLHYASESGHNDAVQALLQWALENSNEGQETVERMLKACDNNDDTPLKLAIHRGHTDVVQTLQQWATTTIHPYKPDTNEQISDLK